MSDRTDPARADRLKKALLEFIQDIEATGGVWRDHRGCYHPAADPDWVDLAESYVRACEALGRTPKVEQRDAEVDDLDDEDEHGDR